MEAITIMKKNVFIENNCEECFENKYLISLCQAIDTKPTPINLKSRILF